MQVRPVITGAISLWLLALASISVAGENLDGATAQYRLEPNDSFRWVVADSYARPRWGTLHAPTLEEQPDTGRHRMGDGILEAGTAERRWADDFIRHRVAATEMSPGLGVAEQAFGARHAFAAASFSAETVEDAVRRFHQEGLPFAHLWQTGSTTLSLGLSPKGKPGLWFTTKV